MKEFIVLLISIATVCLIFHVCDNLELDQARDEYRVWEKATGNPNYLTFEEFTIYKRIR